MTVFVLLLCALGVASQSLDVGAQVRGPLRGYYGRVLITEPAANPIPRAQKRTGQFSGSAVQLLFEACADQSLPH
jgi:hypothetical protein